MEIVINIGLIIGAYLLGSIPSSIWIGKHFYGVDIREHGSHNAGATNMMRVLGRRAALPVYLIDAGKGYAAVMLSFASNLEPYSEGFMYLRIGLIIAVIGGHIFPLFAGFRGGKEVATISGCMIAMAPIPLLFSLLVFVSVLLITKYVSLASIIASAMFPVFVLVKFLVFSEVVSPTLMGFSLITACVMLFMHRNNFKRLLNGTESKTFLIKTNKQTKS